MNADDTAFMGATGTIVGHSLYAYCENNAVSHFDGNGYIKVKIRWWGVTLKFSGKEANGLIYALGIFAAASWSAAELGAPTVIGGIPFGVLAASLSLAAAVIAAINWKNNEKDSLCIVLGQDIVFFGKGGKTKMTKNCCACKCEIGQ